MPETQSETRNHCRHIQPSGHRCGSPSLRHEPFCYYHHTTRKPLTKSEAQTRQARTTEFTLHEPDTRAAIQLNLGEIIRRIADHTLDPKRAGLLLYALQIASSNLPKPNQQDEPEETIDQITLDETHGPLAPEAEFQRISGEKSLEQILLEQWAKDEQDEATRKAKEKLEEEDDDQDDQPINIQACENKSFLKSCPSKAHLNAQSIFSLLSFRGLPGHLSPRRNFDVVPPHRKAIQHAHSPASPRPERTNRDVEADRGLLRQG
jgi:hypothetical protein